MYNLWVFVPHTVQGGGSTEERRLVDECCVMSSGENVCVCVGCWLVCLSAGLHKNYQAYFQET